jgi:hypothetical protein
VNGRASLPRALLLALALYALSCGTPASRAASGKEAQVESCHYEAHVVGVTPLLLDVRVQCAARGPLAFVASERPAARHISKIVDASGRALKRKGAAFTLPTDAVTTTSFSYRVDLDGVARDAESFDVALRSGRSLIAPASTWILHPEPHTSNTQVTLRVHTPKGMGFVTGLAPAGDGYRMDAHEVRVSTYSVFGPRAIETLTLPGPPGGGGIQSRLTVAFADGPLDASTAAVTDWVLRSARAVGKFWGGFPVAHGLVVVIPAEGRRGVAFGKVLPESAPGIVIVVGEHSDAEALDDDWVLVHELFHLGFPSFQDEGKWLDEGLATYYEPIIRARAGKKTEHEVWAEFAHAMPQGLPAMQNEGLEHTKSYRAIYWGGALVALLADVEIRKRTGGRQGLEAGLLEVLAAGGNASEVWTLDRAIRVCDSAWGLGTLRTLAARHAHRGSVVDLDGLWRELGVVRLERGVRLRDDAPMSHIRKAIVFGAP